uniref:Transposase n=1 Tax=Rhabditophanes sp. KR3021 TaxID=114890 RepID=A0AC35UHB0_9BILA
MYGWSVCIGFNDIKVKIKPNSEPNQQYKVGAKTKLDDNVVIQIKAYKYFGAQLYYLNVQTNYMRKVLRKKPLNTTLLKNS